MIAAPLKREDAEAGFAPAYPFPRSNDRGPIEAIKYGALIVGNHLISAIE